MVTATEAGALGTFASLILSILFVLVWKSKSGGAVRLLITEAFGETGALTAMIFALIVIHLSIHYVLQSWNVNEGSANPGGMDYRYVIKALIPVGFGLFFAQSLSEAIKSAIAYRNVRDV